MMTSLDNTSTTFEDSGIGYDADSPLPSPTPPDEVTAMFLECDDIKAMKRHLEKCLKSEKDFVDEIIYYHEADEDVVMNNNNDDKPTVSHSKQYLKQQIADLKAVREAQWNQLEEKRTNMEKLEKALPAANQNKNDYYEYWKTMDTIIYAIYDLPESNQKLSYEKLIKTISKKQHLATLKQEMMIKLEEELQEETAVMEEDAKKRDKEWMQFQNETKEEAAERKYNYENLDAFLKAKKNNLSRVNEELAKLREDIEELEARLEADARKVKNQVKEGEAKKASLRKEYEWSDSVLKEKLLELEKLKAQVAAEKANTSLTYFTRCEKLESELTKLKTTNAKHVKRLNDTNSMFDEIESLINDALRKCKPTLKVGDDADVVVKQILQRFRFGSSNNLNTYNTCERLSFDPVNRTPRDSLSARPDQSTHYDRLSGSFSNSPKSNRQRPSSVSSQFKSVLRNYAASFPRSNSASRIPTR